jgi:hypothetical protein
MVSLAMRWDKRARPYPKPFLSKYNNEPQEPILMPAIRLFPLPTRGVT